MFSWSGVVPLGYFVDLSLSSFLQKLLERGADLGVLLHLFGWTSSDT
jgi:hypothetical protein